MPPPTNQHWQCQCHHGHILCTRCNGASTQQVRQVKRTLTRRDSSLRWRSTSLGTISNNAQASSLRGLPIFAYDQTKFVISCDSCVAV